VNAGKDKPIRFSHHARERLRDRGATEEEVVETIRTTPWTPAQAQRFECHRNFPYGADWNGRLYATKQVRPIFVEEASHIVVVTVYVYFF
jgi:hypothetical protein